MSRHLEVEESRYSGFAQKSAAATGREEDAKSKFLELKDAKNPLPASKETFDLLPPSLHLTGPCYTSFRTFVLTHTGWNVRRRKATEDEKEEHKMSARKSAAYFVTATFDPKKLPKEKKEPARKRKAAESATPKKKAKKD